MIKKLFLGSLVLAAPFTFNINQAHAEEKTQTPPVNQIKDTTFDLSNPSEQTKIIKNKDGSQTILTMSAVPNSKIQTFNADSYDSLPVGTGTRHIKAASWTVTFEFDVKYVIPKDMSKSYIKSMSNTEYRSMLGTLSDIKPYRSNSTAKLSGTYTVLNSFSSQKVWLKTDIFRNSLNTSTNIS